jgi:hypothetical protein
MVVVPLLPLSPQDIPEGVRGGQKQNAEFILIMS